LGGERVREPDPDREAAGERVREPDPDREAIGEPDPEREAAGERVREPDPEREAIGEPDPDREAIDEREAPSSSTTSDTSSASSRVAIRRLRAVGLADIMIDNFTKTLLFYLRNIFVFDSNFITTINVNR
jgi:hypothetical protein